MKSDTPFEKIFGDLMNGKVQGTDLLDLKASMDALIEVLGELVVQIEDREEANANNEAFRKDSHRGEQ